MRMTLRLLESQWAPFVATLCSRRDVETAGIILAEPLNGGQVLFARRLQVVPDGGYQIRRVDRLRVDPVAINRLIREARDRGWSVLTVHTHPGTTHPWFSRADDEGDARLIPSLFSQTPGPHGSIVLAGDTGTPAGRVWFATGEKADIGVHIVGRHLQILPCATGTPEDQPWFDRQRLALGAQGQEMLKDLHVGVVGLGGTGSVVFAQLCHLGVKRISAIDGETVENSNVSRILGATVNDAGITGKVDVAARYATQLGLNTEVQSVNAPIDTESSTAPIEGCDVILSCVDRQVPRVLLNRLSYTKAIPVIDMGSAFRLDRSGRVVAGAGRVVVVGPGRPCLGCWGHIDPVRLREESLSAGARMAAAAEGYIEGADVSQPSVVAFNTMIAGAAVIEFLRLVTGFAGAGDPPMRLSFDFTRGTVLRNRLRGATTCSICTPGPARPLSSAAGGRPANAPSGV